MRVIIFHNMNYAIAHCFGSQIQRTEKVNAENSTLSGQKSKGSSQLQFKLWNRSARRWNCNSKALLAMTSGK
jgi:hypothetical protein